MNIEHVLYKWISHLYNHDTSRCVYSLQKINSYMTKLPFVIQEMHDKNENANMSPWQLKIKRCNASITWHKGWKYKPFFGHLNNPKRSCPNFCIDEKFNQRFCLKYNLLRKNVVTNDSILDI